MVSTELEQDTPERKSNPVGQPETTHLRPRAVVRVNAGAMRARPLVGVLCLLAGIATARGQDAAFEIASVKVNTSDAPVSRMTAPDGTGRFEATNVPVRMLILNAYGIPGFQLAGGPSWVDSLRVDVLGRGAANASRAEISAMVRTLLAERFSLVVGATVARCRCMRWSSRAPIGGSGRACRAQRQTAPPLRHLELRRPRLRPDSCSAPHGCPRSRSTLAV